MISENKVCTSNMAPGHSSTQQGERRNHSQSDRVSVPQPKRPLILSKGVLTDREGRGDTL